MTLGRWLHPGSPARALARADAAPPGRRDRATAFAAGVLLGLATVAVDRSRASRAAAGPRAGTSRRLSASSADTTPARAKIAGEGWLPTARRTWAEFSQDRI